MKVSYGEGLANHTVSESCGVAREGGFEALTEEGAGRVFSRETFTLRNADAFRVGGRHNRIRRYREALPSSARSQTPSTHRSTCTGTGRSRVLSKRKMAWDASGSLRTYADEERTREVGQTCSTCEVLEQGWATGGGGDGGKRFDQGESATAKRVPDSEPDRRAQCAAADTSSSKQG